MTDELMHYGTPRHSGRYPWGSGENPQRNRDFLGYAKDLKAKGMSETEIAEAMGMTTTELRAKKSLAKNAQLAENIARAKELKDKGYSNVKIGEMMGGVNESTVRSWLKPTLEARTRLTDNTADMLRDNVKKKSYIDIGAGVELDVGVTSTRFKNAIAKLKDEGYSVYYLKEEQVGNPGKFTTIKVLAAPGTTYQEVYKNCANIGTITDYMVDGGEKVKTVKPPKSISSERVMVRYGDQGGTAMDGVIQLRPGVEDISLGNSKYAQVRIAVDGTHYLKGMAMYSNDIPAGYDIVFNTNKKSDKSKLEVMKPMKDDPDNPFGALIKANGQRTYIDKDGKEQLSVINKLREEGDWDTYSKTLSSQFLSKQPQQLIDKQLKLSYIDKKNEYDEISALTNPVVKKKLLTSFADDCDSSAVHLKAAALPRQSTRVILPISSMKDNEIYAPTYRNGEKVALVRYPHGGTFEIPVLTVNNKQPVAKGILGNVKDAVGINSHVAERLSGADFDGDTVLVIPTNDKVKIKSTKALEGLKDFDPKEAYPGYPGMPKIKSKTKQTEMGRVSNLITDMTLKGATEDELARAVRHSMVVIDAEKHNLDYKRSFVDNGIGELKAKYQGSERSGASTLISKAKSETRVDERVEGKYVTDPVTGKTTKRYVDPDTGEKLYTETGTSYVDKNGKTVYRKTTSTKMYETNDARTLSSGTPQEEAYAKYANSIKALGNDARKQALLTKNMEYSPAAKKTYVAEVESLNTKLMVALKNKPRERQAQLIANSIISAKKNSNPDMTSEDLKKEKSRALAEARARVGASKTPVTITEREWEAIQAGAISSSKLSQILDNADLDSVKKLATPKSVNTLSEAKVSKIKAMNASGYTIAEIAQALGKSTSTVSKYLN